jgi:tRNA (adenine37-N6)-methyltransferase
MTVPPTNPIGGKCGPDKMNMDLPSDFIVRPIGIIHSCYPEKFGIPRQPGLVKSATARLEMLPPCNRLEMFKGLERFSHVWLSFLFHQTLREGWKRTVRPPWLGGREKVGVFASRSPHRPNHLGLSVVRLVKIGKEGKKIYLDLAEIDLLDATSVIDIKPYIPYCDRLDEATNGYSNPLPEPVIEVVFNEEATNFCCLYEQKTGRRLSRLIRETLALDPRPAGHRAKSGEYGMRFWDVNVRWQADKAVFRVVTCRYARDGRTPG